MRVVNRNRYIRGNTENATQGGNGSNVAVYTEVIQLTQSFDIIQVIDATTVQITFGDPLPFPQGQLAIIDGSTTGTNDGLYEVDSVAVLGVDVMNVTFTEANLTVGLLEDGLLHIVRDVQVQHDLDTVDVVYRLKNITTGATTLLNDDSTDNNLLILKPQVPVVGDFRISVFG